MWLNEDSTPQYEIRKALDFELKNALRNKGIDIRDRALTIKSARDHIYEKELQLRSFNLYSERATQMATDEKLRERYYDQVRDEVNSLETQPKVFYERVNQHIHKIFEDAYIEKLNKIYGKSKEI